MTVHSGQTTLNASNCLWLLNYPFNHSLGHRGSIHNGIIIKIINLRNRFIISRIKFVYVLN